MAIELARKPFRYAACVLLALVFCQIVMCQAPSPPTRPAPTIQAAGQESSTLLEYAKFIREEEKSHREYLEKLYTTTVAVLGLLILTGIGLIGFLQFKTKKEVREEVRARFEATIEQELRSTLREYREQLAEVKRELEEFRSAMAEPRETAASATPAGITPEEAAVLKEAGESKFSFRTLIGIAQGAAKRPATKDITVDAVRRHLDTLTGKGYIGKTLGKQGGERWYVTEAGRRFLLSNLQNN